MPQTERKSPQNQYRPELGCSVSFRVRYYETDNMGITHHSNYLRWFEVGRTEYLRAADMTYASLEAMGLGSPVIGARCRYLHSSCYDDLITVQAWIKSYNGVRLTIAYAIWRSGLLICDGETDHAFVWKGRPVALGRSLPQIHALMLAGMAKDHSVLRTNEDGSCTGSDQVWP